MKYAHTDTKVTLTLPKKSFSLPAELSLLLVAQT